MQTTLSRHIFEAFTTYFKATVCDPCKDIKKICDEKAAQAPRRAKFVSPWEIARKQAAMTSPEGRFTPAIAAQQVICVITH